uniref:IF rod domain-containing protein n=1 Tax=Glossina pallidipes TaxID=7398 RepID=A0A1B0AAX1_GLOPL
MSECVSAVIPEPPPNGPSTASVPHSNPSAGSICRHSRLQDTAELQKLNDRLAAYMGRMRNLKNDHTRLSIEVQTARDNLTRENDCIKNIYESELTDMRRSLHEIARNKAELQIRLNHQGEENKELKAKLDNKAKECSIFEANARKYKSCTTDLIAKYSALKADREKAINEATELQIEHDRLSNSLNEALENLKKARSIRVNLANNVQSLREELTLKDQLHAQEISEARSRRQVKIKDIGGGHLFKQYQGELQKLRNHYAAQMQANRDEIKIAYEHKFKNLQPVAALNENATAAVRKELRCAREIVEDLTGRISKLKSSNADLNSRIRVKEQLLDDEGVRHTADVASLENELQRLRNAMSHQLRQYQDLMDIKVSLDLEIGAYDKLLCGDLTHSSGGSAGGSPDQFLSFPSGAKRKAPMPVASPASVKRKSSVVDESERVASMLDDGINENMCHPKVGPDQQVTDECLSLRYHQQNP